MTLDTTRLELSAEKILFEDAEIGTQLDLERCTLSKREKTLIESKGSFLRALLAVQEELIFIHRGEKG